MAVATRAAVVTQLVLGTDQVGPVVIVLDWLVAPPARRPSIATAASWLAFPVVWLVYTFVRAAVVDWYPYPFLDPDDKGLGAVVVCRHHGAVRAAAAGLRWWAGLGDDPTGSPVRAAASGPGADPRP